MFEFFFIIINMNFKKIFMDSRLDQRYKIIPIYYLKKNKADKKFIFKNRNNK